MIKQSSEDRIREELYKSYKRLKAVWYVERNLPLTMYHDSIRGQRMVWRRYKNDRECRAERAYDKLIKLQKVFQEEYLNYDYRRVYRKDLENISLMEIYNTFQ